MVLPDDDGPGSVTVLTLTMSLARSRTNVRTKLSAAMTIAPPESAAVIASPADMASSVTPITRAAETPATGAQSRVSPSTLATISLHVWHCQM